MEKGEIHRAYYVNIDDESEWSHSLLGLLYLP